MNENRKMKIGDTIAQQVCIHHDLAQVALFNKKTNTGVNREGANKIQ